jgi:predicted Zn-dependent peptidase
VLQLLTATQTEIYPRVTLTCVNTDKFKTGCLSISLITELSADTASKNALLPRVLRRGTAFHPDMESISKSLDLMYGARIEPLVRKKGELQCVGFYCDFIDDDFVPKGERILERAASLVGEMLLSPLTHGGILTADSVEGEKKNLIDEIRAGVNDKRQYAVDRLIENMCAGEAFGVNKLGTQSAVSEITPMALTKHYKALIAGADIRVFYCGMAEPERVRAAVCDALAGIPREAGFHQNETDVRIAPQSDITREFTERLDVTQGKLTMGYRLGETMLTPNYSALAVFNAVFGGSVTSKLFLNVREKLSLCYYASSVIEKHKGVMIVSSGVEFSKADEARREITAQLDAIRAGDISEWELTSARRAVTTAIKSALDRPAGVEEQYFDRALLRLPHTPDELAALSDGVTRDEVIAIAKSVVPDATYFLTGTEVSADGQ